MKSTSYPLLIFLLAVGSFVTGTSEFVVSGILDIISDDLRISIPVAGQLITIYSLFYAVGALFLVMATSKLNRKKVLLSAISIFIAGNVLAFFSHHFMLLMLSRVIMAMSGGLYIVLATNYAAQLAPPEKKGSAMATVITGFTVSLVLGVPIGTFLAGYVDWHAIFLIIAIGTACLLFLLYQLLPPMEGHSHVPFKQQMQILQDRRVLSGLATTAFWILGYTMVFAYISPLLRQTSGFTLELTSIALLVLGISAFIGSRFGGYAVDQWGPNRTISISITVQMLMLFALSFTQFSVVGVFITLAIWGTATWTTTPAKQFYLISLKPETSETVLSFNTAIMNIGMMLGSSMGGLIIQYTNVTNLSWIGGLASFVALMLIRYSFNRHRLANQQIKSEHV
ncbi:MFS transporter [Bacillus altitudinis]|uniref:MFS transporter, DHA1 family, purine base/nucleoside efflux pump n=1 Tax=Bacillus altitudinis TaxID=293387 RepID=A0A653MF23_BACAB|nr:MFS transporter [Bacillus altitudinis]WHY06090.1 MFS transporter [Bacillus altitudinis]VXA97150.1 MFS transporter, DHA1 family, purine base/nucleoside efflux pump [Bacillus altitudinis]VXB02707.1 MFS transporter, DHA1 family, purine base/nucleoside efflux pump [Bacillus altitudinis]